MAIDHTVVQGEYLSKIARSYGFSDYRTIWEHPKNAALKQARQNPNVLFPGDRLFIPDIPILVRTAATV
jgi:nucleoid-associated protein YgaU